MPPMTPSTRSRACSKCFYKGCQAFETIGLVPIIGFLETKRVDSDIHAAGPVRCTRSQASPARARVMKGKASQLAVRRQSVHKRPFVKSQATQGLALFAAAAPG